MKSRSSDYELAWRSRLLIKAEPGGRVRVETGGPGGITQVYDGKTLWIYNSHLKQYTETPFTGSTVQVLQSGPAAILVAERAGLAIKTARISGAKL